MRTKDQLRLDIEAERFTDREKKIQSLLREYRTIDRQIEYYERQAKGDGLVHQPSVTAAPPVEDDPWILVQRSTEPLTDSQREMVSVVTKYIGPESFTYATCKRVADKLSNVVSDDQGEDEVIQLMFTMMRGAHASEERVELTDTERLAIIREREINAARIRLPVLKEHRKHVGYALDTMAQYYTYYYHLLVWRYVQDLPVDTVQEQLGKIRPVRKREPVPLSRDEWIKDRREAMQEFARWIPSHLLGG